MVQLSHPYMTTGKTIALTRQTLVGKVMSLLLNILSRLVITFLDRVPGDIAPVAQVLLASAKAFFLTGAWSPTSPALIPVSLL